MQQLNKSINKSMHTYIYIYMYTLFITRLLPTTETGMQIKIVETPQRAAGLLNKICPDNVDSIIEKIAAITVNDIKELEVIF